MPLGPDKQSDTNWVKSKLRSFEHRPRTLLVGNSLFNWLSNISCWTFSWASLFIRSSAYSNSVVILVVLVFNKSLQHFKWYSTTCRAKKNNAHHPNAKITLMSHRISYPRDRFRATLDRQCVVMRNCMISYIYYIFLTTRFCLYWIH